MLSDTVYKCLGLDFLSHVGHHAIYVSDPSGRIVFWNQGAANLFGWERSEILDDKLATWDESALFLPDDRWRGECDRERVRAVADGVVMGERWYVRRDGSQFVGNSTLFPLYEGDATEKGSRGIQWFVRIVQDVTSKELHQVELETSLNHQRRVMQRLEETQLPALTNTFDGVQVSALYQPIVPEDRVGGDLYDAFLLEDGGVALFVGDASGKGLEASARATEVRYSLRAFLREDPDPARAVARVNDMLCRCATLEQRDSAMFTTLTLAVVYSQRRVAHLVHAGGEYPVRVDAQGNPHEIVEDEYMGMALGIAPDQSYKVLEIPLELGDCLLLFTDGITESRRDRNFFGTSGVVEAMRNTQKRRPGVPMSARLLAEDVMEQATRFHKALSRDDMCLVSVQVTQ